MATTDAAALINPEIWADMVQAEFLGRLRFGALAISDDRLEGQPGDTVTFPFWQSISDAEDLDEGTPMTPEAMTANGGNAATIKEVGKAVELYDKALLTGYGDPMGEARRQLSIVMARKVDLDLKNEAEANLPDSQKIGDSTTALDWDLFVDATTTFGDFYDAQSMAGLVVHSQQHAGLLKDPNFVRASRSGETSTLVSGMVGSIGGVPVIVSDRVTDNGDNGNGVHSYNALLIRRGALMLLYKRRPIVETFRDILARSNLLTTNVHYATHRTVPDLYPYVCQIQAIPGTGAGA